MSGICRTSRFASNISVEVDIDVDELLCEVTTEQLATELKSRNQETTNSSKAQVQQAIAQIRRGAHQDAITTLEREFFPKWQTSGESEQAYRQAIGAVQ